MGTHDECRCYVEHLIAEHCRLHRMLSEARAAIIGSGGPDRDATSADVVRTLRQVRSELAHHFAQEEAGGCLDEAVSCCPSLSDEALRIEAEHRQLLENIDRLIAQAMDCDQSVAKRIALERGVEELYRQLETHEAAENALLSTGFGVNVNGGESIQSTLTQDV